MSTIKKLSNPFSTGSGGSHFEAHVQALFVVLMLAGGRSPCFPRWPVVKIKLQGKIIGFDTDDLVVFVGNPASKERRKLLGQVKRSIDITQRSVLFGKVMQAAWNDSNKPEVFTKDKDVIALITGPLSATDVRNVQWLLSQARYTENVDEFFTHVHKAKFSPPKSKEKLEVFKHHLKKANDDKIISRDEIYEFLNHFHILSYDLGDESGTFLSMLHSLISQFQPRDPQWVWSRAVEVVQTWNQNAGTITPENLPEDLQEIFKKRPVEEMPEEFKAVHEMSTTDWTQHPDATYLALTVLVGAWNEQTPCDVDTISQLLGISYDEWLKKAQEILLIHDSPLSLKNGIWKVVNRVELWSQLGSRILDKNLDTFRSLAVSILTEPDPAFELPTEERYSASIHGKVLKCSHTMRRGIVEGLAIMGNMPDACSNCSYRKAITICKLVTREILSDADWIRWGSVNRLLPTLAEANPDEFLDAVEKALSQIPCPFDELFAQEGNGITGGNYLIGLLSALEGLAWGEQYLVRVCVVLGELSSHDPGGHWANRPFNSLSTILLPWLPQTIASFDKRKVAVQTLLIECPEIAWNLIIQLLSSQHRISFGTNKPIWRKTIPDNWKKGVTHEEYYQQIFFYAELAVATARHEIGRLTELIDHFENLPQPAFVQLIEVLTSPPVSTFPEEQRLQLWNRLKKLTKKHRRFSNAQWAMNEDLITSLETVTKKLTPTNPFYRYQYLFTYDDFEELGERIDSEREEALSEIYKDGVQSVIQFAESVASPHKVGYTLVNIADDVIHQTLLPQLLDSSDNKRKALVSEFIFQSYNMKFWEWCDSIDKSDWTPAQKGKFLACLPFVKEVWGGASNWLPENDDEYWIRTDANPNYQTDSDFAVAIEKLVEHGRPFAAIRCLDKMRFDPVQTIDIDQWRPNIDRHTLFQ